MVASSDPSAGATADLSANGTTVPVDKPADHTTEAATTQPVVTTAAAAPAPTALHVDTSKKEAPVEAKADEAVNGPAETKIIAVPDDVAVVGWDDVMAARYVRPALTTVRQPLFDMGRMAMRSTMSVVRGDPRITPHIELATTLVERDSTAAAPRSTTATPPAPAEATAAGKGI